MLLPLAWLVRVDDTPEHREWLRQVATDLVSDMDLVDLVHLVALRELVDVVA